MQLQKLFFKTITLFALLFTACQAQEPAASAWVMGYYTGYNQNLYPPEAIQFSALSHIAMGAILPKSDDTLNTDFYLDPVRGPALAKRISQLAHQNNKKAILMIGGAGSNNWQAASSSATRASFIQNLLNTMNELGYDGLDIDWEPVSVADAPLLLALSQELRAAKPNMLLTIPIGWANPNYAQPELNVYKELVPFYDQINIMSYGMASANWGWEQVWHSSALFHASNKTPSSVDASVQFFLKLGVPAKKLGLGIGFYGTCWKTVSQPLESLIAKTPSDVMGPSDNALSYTNIMTDYFSANAKKWDDAAKVPYLSSATPLGPEQCNFVSYEDEQSIAEKGLYAKKWGLGGAIIWSINQGYLPNNPENQRDPLMNAVQSAFMK